MRRQDKRIDVSASIIKDKNPNPLPIYFGFSVSILISKKSIYRSRKKRSNPSLD